MPELQPPAHITAWMNTANDRPLSFYQGYFGQDIGTRPELILDVAAGVGVAGHQINTSPDHQAVVVAADLTYPYLRPMNEIAVAADALALPFADNTFDRVICSWLLAHFKPSDAAQVLSEMLRVARPGADVMVNPSTYLSRLGSEEFAYKRLLDRPSWLDPVPRLLPTLVIPKPEDYPDWLEEEKRLACRSLARQVTLRNETSPLMWLRQALAGVLRRR